MIKESKHPEMKSPVNAREYNEKKKEGFAKDESEIHPVHGEKGKEEEAKAQEECDTKVVKEVQVPKEDEKAKDQGGGHEATAFG